MSAGASCQATIHHFDSETLHGEVITDTGRVIPFSSDVFMRSGLRLARTGQRLNIEVGTSGIERLWMDGVGAGQQIS